MMEVDSGVDFGVDFKILGDECKCGYVGVGFLWGGIWFGGVLWVDFFFFE